MAPSKRKVAQAPSSLQLFHPGHWGSPKNSRYQETIQRHPYKVRKYLAESLEFCLTFPNNFGKRIEGYQGVFISQINSGSLVFELFFNDKRMQNQRESDRCTTLDLGHG